MYHLSIKLRIYLFIRFRELSNRVFIKSCVQSIPSRNILSTDKVGSKLFRKLENSMQTRLSLLYLDSYLANLVDLLKPLLFKLVNLSINVKVYLNWTDTFILL